MRTSMAQLNVDDGLPNSVHTEVAILGAMLLDSVAISDATAKLVAEDFSLDSHQRIYRVMLALAQSECGVDYLTVQEALSRLRELDAVGGPAYLAYLSEGIPRNFNIESYVQIVKDKSLLRQVMGVCHDGQVRASDQSEDAITVLNDVQASLAEISGDAQVDSTLTRQSEDEFERMERERRGEIKAFMPSGIPHYDDTHGGFAIGEMTVLGARPRIGKSTLLRQTLITNCEAGNFVHFFSPEMRAGQILRCLWAAVAELPFHKVRHPERASYEERLMLKSAKDIVAKWPLKIDDSSPITAAEIINRARRTKAKEGTRLQVVDYLQKLAYRGRSQDRHIEVTDAMVALTSFAKKEQIALVMVSSLTEADRKEKNRVPTIHDLRQSGDIQFEANTVLLLHREIDAETQKLSPETRLIVGKARADEDGARKLYFDGPMQRFVDFEQYMRGLGR